MMVRGLEISDLGSRGIILRVAKTKGLIVKLICVFVLACTKRRFSHNEAHIITAYTKVSTNRDVITGSGDKMWKSTRFNSDKGHDIVYH